MPHSEAPSPGPDRPLLPKRTELEARFQAKVVTFDRDGSELAGGMCGCCGGGPNVSPSWRSEPWYIYKAGLCDSDGVYFSMLCEGCLEEVRAAQQRRPESDRDAIAREVTDLLGDDLDGAQAMMEDFH